VAYFKVLPKCLPGGTEVHHTELQSGHPVSGPRF